MENIVFSLNVVMPVFLLIMIGVLLRKKGIMTEDFRNKVTNLVFYYALPCTLFRDVAGSDFFGSLNMKFVLYALASTFFIFFLSWFLAIVVLKKPAEIGATVHGAFRGNFAYVGMPVLYNLLETDTLIFAVMVITFVIPLYNVLAVWVLSMYDPSGKKTTFKSIALEILKNPLIIAVFLGIPFSILQVSFPAMVNKTLSYMAQLSTPLALLMIGGSLQMNTFASRMKGIALATGIKLILAPLVTVVMGVFLGFTGEALATLFVLQAVPSAANSFIMTKKMNGDAELGAGIVMSTSLLSTVTMAIGIFLLRAFGYV